MTTILITGANQGLGHEAARQLVAAGHTVYIGSRDADRGRRAADETGARTVQLDVTDDASVAAAVKTLEAEGGVDVLINNAGIQAEMTPDGAIATPAETTIDMMRTTFETNVFGVVRVLNAFLPLLEQSPNPVVVNLSSGLSRLTNMATHRWTAVAYPASKAAVNMITVQYAKAFPRMRINAVEPGFTSTAINYGQGAQPVEQGATVIVRMAQLDADGPTGGLFDAEGPLSW